ncbi:MAG TPA: GNAT family N-acetyltransferase [Ktedonobacterales bacterium]
MILENVNRLAHAVEANWCAAWASLGSAPDARNPTHVDDTPTYLRVCTPGVPEMLVNTVLRYYGPSPVMASDVENVIAPYRRHHLPFQWWLMLGEEPRGLRDHLHRLQLQPCGTSTCMALELDAWHAPSAPARSEPGETRQRVTSPEDGDDALRVICDVFYVPAGPMARWTTDNAAFVLYLSRIGDYAASALATLRDGDTVGVYHVGTRSGYRRRGLAGRLLTLALSEAHAAGARLATLTATPEAAPLYESLGFRACGRIEQWIPGPELMGRLYHGSPLAQTLGGGWW